MPQQDSAADSTVLKAGRQRCWQVKNLYFDCLEGHSDVGKATAACKSKRQAFVEGCPASWVKHFDALSERKRQSLQSLHANINRSAAAAKDRRDRDRGRPSSRREEPKRPRDDSVERGDGKRRKKASREDSEEAPGMKPVEVDFDADISAEEMQMMQAMGIPFLFDTTQGKHVEDETANAGAVKAKQTRQARQYMNRRGGFNRPLPLERTGEKQEGN
ncbi:hypothetical protein WJX73_006872 [Symbiochloris irregularis]|uniref:U4/U6.U5 small nuclear ribonucleoprotein 27kDa protein domain-containing protein n=1 Tax=Symbiochloris irregularis TaxID=706552 RepID=A0AAW1NRY9_9CHLO